MKPRWLPIPLNQICNPRQWPTISSRNLLPEGYPVYGANGLIGYYREYNHEHETILVTCRGATCGSINISRPKSYITGNAMCLDDLDLKMCDLRFVFHALIRRGLKDAITGSAQPQITRTSLEKVSIPLPPLPEQKRIAAILDKAGAIRRKRQLSIKLADDFLRATFLDMFGDPVANPKGWQLQALGRYCRDMRYGTSKKCFSHKTIDSLPVLRIPNITAGKIIFDNLVNASLSKQEKNKLKLVDGDLLFVRTNGNPEYIGRSAVFYGSSDMAFASYLIRARLDLKYDLLPEYVQACLSTKQYRTIIIKEAKTTAGNFNINTQGLKGLKIPIAPLEMQKEYIKVKAALEDLLKKEMLNFAYASSLFNSLTQRAFRGEL